MHVDSYIHLNILLHVLINQVIHIYILHIYKITYDNQISNTINYASAEYMFYYIIMNNNNNMVIRIHNTFMIYGIHVHAHVVSRTHT